MGMYEDNLLFDSYDDLYGEERERYHIIPFKEIVARTKKAILFENINGQFWLPRSIITINQKAKTVDVPVWCDWKYIDDTPPPHPNPKGVIRGKQKK